MSVVENESERWRGGDRVGDGGGDGGGVGDSSDMWDK